MCYVVNYGLFIANYPLILHPVVEMNIGELFEKSLNTAGWGRSGDLRWHIISFRQRSKNSSCNTKRGA